MINGSILLAENLEDEMPFSEENAMLAEPQPSEDITSEVETEEDIEGIVQAMREIAVTVPKSESVVAAEKPAQPAESHPAEERSRPVKPSQPASRPVVRPPRPRPQYGPRIQDGQPASQQPSSTPGCIGIWGARSAGKTTYLAMLCHALDLRLRYSSFR